MAIEFFLKHAIFFKQWELFGRILDVNASLLQQFAGQFESSQHKQKQAIIQIAVDQQIIKVWLNWLDCQKITHRL